ncbi:type VII secretion target [Actinomycetospora rhizophila]|uniref:Type VII secretion target n=1 Tax=Actinomycetospora rhizophila TaxID=1416876 RepID=A0ABV9Z683_9PSEU
MTGGYAVDLEALHRAAQGIRATVDQVGVGQLDGVGTAAGHERLNDALAEFATRWQRGVEALAEDGHAVADRLDAAEAGYRRTDTGAARGLDGLVRGSGPDPGGG